MNKPTRVVLLGEADKEFKMSEIFHQFITGGWKPITLKIQKISEHAQKPLCCFALANLSYSMGGGF